MPFGVSLAGAPPLLDTDTMTAPRLASRTKTNGRLDLTAAAIAEAAAGAPLPELIGTMAQAVRDDLLDRLARLPQRTDLDATTTQTEAAVQAWVSDQLPQIVEAAVVQRLTPVREMLATAMQQGAGADAEAWRQCTNVVQEQAIEAAVVARLEPLRKAMAEMTQTLTRRIEVMQENQDALWRNCEMMVREEVAKLHVAQAEGLKALAAALQARPAQVLSPTFHVTPAIDLHATLEMPTRKRTSTRHHLYDEASGLPVSSIEETVEESVPAEQQQPGRSGREFMAPTTIKVRLQFLHTVLAWAVEQKFIPTVPKFPKIKVPKTRPAPVAGEAFERILVQARDQAMRAYLLCGWLAGLRLGEALALEWEPTAKAPWVDFDRDRIWLPGEFTKGDQDQWLPLDPQLREALVALPRQGRTVFRFTSRQTGESIKESAMSLRVIALAKKAGVKLSMHTLRKGFGCRYAAKVSAHVLQRLMRHASIGTTMDYYANIDDAVEEAVLGKRRNKIRNSRSQAGCQESSVSDASSSEGKANGNRSFS